MNPKHGAEPDCLLFPPNPPLARQRLAEAAVRLRRQLRPCYQRRLASARNGHKAGQCEGALAPEAKNREKVEGERPAFSHIPRGDFRGQAGCLKKSLGICSWPRFTVCRRSRHSNVVSQNDDSDFIEGFPTFIVGHDDIGSMLNRSCQL